MMYRLYALAGPYDMSRIEMLKYLEILLGPQPATYHLTSN